MGNASLAGVCSCLAGHAQARSGSLHPAPGEPSPGFVLFVVLAGVLGVVFVAMVALWLIRRKSLQRAKEEKGVIYKPAVTTEEEEEEDLSKA